MSWPRKPLGTVATIDRRGVAPESIGAGVLYIGLENIERGGRIVGVTPTTDGQLASTKFSFDTRHVLFGKLRPNLAKIARPTFEGVCSTDILPLRPGPQLDRDYLAHFLALPDIVRLATSRATGVNLPRLSPTELQKFELPLPPIEEQRRIADILDRADAVRTKRREAVIQLDDLTRSIFLDMFGPRKALARQPLGDLIKLKSGEFLPSSAMATDGKFPVLGGNGINGMHDRYLFEDPRIVLGRVGAYCGCVHVSPPRAWVTDNALYVSWMDASLQMDYLSAALEHANLNQYASQSGQPLISGSRIYPIEIPVPPEPAQLKFACIVQQLRVTRSADNMHLAELDTLFSSLQQRAFAGLL